MTDTQDREQPEITAKKKNPVESSSNDAQQPERESSKEILRQDCVVKVDSIPLIAQEHRVFVESETFYRSRFVKSAHWSIAWSDLMMTMFILFAVMYAYHAAQKDFLAGEDLGSEIGTATGLGVMGQGGGGGIGPKALPQETAPSHLFDLGKETMRLDILNEIAKVDLAPDESVRIILTGDLLFDTGKAELKEEAKKSLNRVAEVLWRTSYMINVVGHTDSVPIHSDQFPTNWELSVIRATVVARYLIEHMQLPANRFYITGHSYYRPVRPNNNITDRAANRRVEIIITRDIPKGLPDFRERNRQ